MAEIRYYMDHHIHSAITLGLKRLGIDCLTAQEDGRARTPDDVLLQRATDLGRVLFSQDLDLWNIGWDWMSTGRDFAGIVYAEQYAMSIGDFIYQLRMIAVAMTADEMRNRIIRLPL